MSNLKLVFSSAKARQPLLAPTLSSQIVAQIRDAVSAGELKPGDFVGSEKSIAEHAGVSRMAARDALRTLTALGIVEIKVGAGGGVRIASGNPQLLAEALAIQFDLTGVSAAEILDAQRAIEGLTAELAALNATKEDNAILRELLLRASQCTNDASAFTQLGREFHLAIAHASHNRVLVVQLLSLQHVSWPKSNPTLTPDLAEHIIDTHRQIADRIEWRDPNGARELMNSHVKMIRARRTSDDASGGNTGDFENCC